ncbi:MAG: hypothetical protein QXP36_00885 [Conexivisphaerales archaeon]
MPKDYRLTIRLEPPSGASADEMALVLEHSVVAEHREELYVSLERRICGPSGCEKAVKRYAISDLPRGLAEVVLEIDSCMYRMETLEDQIDCVKLKAYERLDEILKAFGYVPDRRVRVFVSLDDSRTTYYVENGRQIVAYRAEVRVPVGGVDYKMTVDRSFRSLVVSVETDGGACKPVEKGTLLWELALVVDSLIYGRDAGDLSQIERDIRNMVERIGTWRLAERLKELCQTN